MRTGEVEAHPGHVEALVPPASNIHSVTAAGTSKTISIHVYGADIERLGSSILRRYDEPAPARQRRVRRRPSLYAPGRRIGLTSSALLGRGWLA